MPGVDLEQMLSARGHVLVGACDEVGRGCWAGPLTVCAVVVEVRSGFVVAVPAGLDDSKRLTPARRRALVPQLEARVAGHHSADVDAGTIDEMGMAAALRHAFCAAVDGLVPVPGVVLVDGPVDFLAGGHGWSGPVQTVVGGDAASVSIAAASVLAKQHRDALMVAEAEALPQWEFAQHKGYPTLAHRRAVEQHGLSRLHRRSWKVIPA